MVLDSFYLLGVAATSACSAMLTESDYRIANATVSREGEQSFLQRTLHEVDLVRVL
jgi:hypothetical protein